jgi:hypothetical protein
MLLHSWFRTIHFLCGALMISSPNALTIAPWLLRIHPSQVSTSTIRLIPPSIQDTEIDQQSSDRPEDRAYQVCMAAFATLTPTLINTSTTPESPGSDPLSDRPIENPDATVTRLDLNLDPVLTAPGIALYRQTSADRRNNHDDETFAISSEADAGRDPGNHDDQPIAKATTLIYRVDLSQGAQLDLAGAIALDPSDTEAHPSAAYDTQRDPHVPPRSLSDHWQAIRTAHPDRAFAAINGQFFGATPVRLAFPVKAGGEIISGGYAGSGEYDGEKMMLAIAGQTATIAPFPETGSPGNPLFSSIPDLIVGLHPCADKGRDRVVGRTLIGIADRDGNGLAETLLIVVASHATQADAILTLQRFGAIAAVMLDGGGSSQSLALGQIYLASSDRHPRAIPHAIGLLSGVETSK